LKKIGFYNESNIIKHVEKLKSGKLKDDNSFRQLLFLSTMTLWNEIFIENEITKNPVLDINRYL